MFIMTKVNYRYIFIGVLLLTAVSIIITSFTDPGEAEISNGIITARLYLPDAVNGYYRGVRFDYSGIISSLSYGKHSYYGDWYIFKYKSTNNDAVMGPSEAFDPVGYEEAKSGGTFLKIGVGVLAKPNDSAYKFSRLYAVTNPGKWKVTVKADRIKFMQTLSDTSYSYSYQKTVQLIKNKPILVLSHVLKNTGKTAIKTAVFDHNFLVMDNQPTGPDFVLTFPFSLNGVYNRRPDYLKLLDNQLSFLKVLEKRQVAVTDLTNGNGAANYDFKVENHSTGAGVHVTADRPVLKMAFWASPKTICPEPYINIDVNPGEEFTWTITYQYYNCSITK